MLVDESETAARILVVEDEAIIANDLKRRLERLGYEVVGIADNGADALAMAATTSPSLVFMDIIIQGPDDGITTAAELMRRVDVPVIFLTAHSDTATLQRAKAVRPYGYLIKPFEERELRTTIEMALYRHRSEAKARILSQALESARTGIAIVDARTKDRRFIFTNPALVNITGYSEQELHASNPLILAGPETDSASRAELERALVEKTRCRVTLMAHKKDGAGFWCDVTVSPVSNLIGEVTHLMCSFDDVTTRKRTEESLLQTQKMEALGQLTGGVAHDFNNILSVILSFATLIRDALPKGDVIRDDVGEIMNAVDKAAGLTRQLLTFARHQPSQKEAIDLNARMAELLTFLRRSVGARVRVEVVPSARRAVVRMDPVQLDQVLLNLAINARDAMTTGDLRFTVTIPEVASERFPAGRYARITCSDNGHGMDRATLARIFEPFYTTKPVGKGTGLGLATCFAIVGDAGGTIHAESAVGKGSTFTIDLPLTDDAVVDDAEQLSAHLRGEGERILVIEDDAALCNASVRMLTSAGYKASFAHNGEEAIRLIANAKEDFALVFSDVVMPGTGGYAVAAYVKEHAPKTSVLLSSGYLDARAADASGVDETPLLWKPYTSESLLRSVHAVLKQLPRDSHESPPSDGPPSKSVILLVEDDATMSSAIQRMLVAVGYRVVIAGSVKGAMTEIEQDPNFAAVVCDLTLSDGSGADVLSRMRSLRPELARRTVVLTGGATDEAGWSVINDGVTEVLRKPVAPRMLLERISVLTGRVLDAAIDSESEPE